MLSTLVGPGVESQPDDVVAVADDDVVGDRPGGDQPDAGDGVELRIQGGKLLPR